MALLTIPAVFTRDELPPVEERISRVVDRMLHDFNGCLMSPKWDNIEDQNAFGKLTNDGNDFGIELDVSHFRPDELTVNVREDELCVEGHHKERTNEHGSVERHFIRKYTIPTDVLQNSIESQLSGQGILRISAKKRSIQKPKYRKIPVKIAKH